MRNVHILLTEIKDVATGAGEVTQFVKFLAYKREDLNLNPSTHRKVDAVACISNPSFNRVEMGDPGACRSSRLVSQNVSPIWTKKNIQLNSTILLTWLHPVLSFLWNLTTKNLAINSKNINLDWKSVDIWVMWSHVAWPLCLLLAHWPSTGSFASRSQTLSQMVSLLKQLHNTTT